MWIKASSETWFKSEDVAMLITNSEGEWWYSVAVMKSGAEIEIARCVSCNTAAAVNNHIAMYEAVYESFRVEPLGSDEFRIIFTGIGRGGIKYESFILL